MKPRGSRTASISLVAVLALAGCTGGNQQDVPTGTPVAAVPTPSAPMPSIASPSQVAAPPPSASVPTAVIDPLVAGSLATRVVIPELAIDLPIVSGDLVLPGNPPDFPLCDVAQYLTIYRFPGQLGTTTWIYAHARDGMFLTLLEASERADGQELIGMTVQLFTDAGMRYTFEITDVVRHATDRGIARNVADDDRRLVLQTSEGPKGTVPKLQVAARFVAEKAASLAEAVPPARPRVCAG